MWRDNQGAQALALNPVYHSKTKHIELDFHFVRSLVADKGLEVHYVPIEEQPTNLLTKAMSYDQFSFLYNKLTLDYSLYSLKGHIEAISVASLATSA